MNKIFKSMNCKIIFYILTLITFGFLLISCASVKTDGADLTGLKNEKMFEKTAPSQKSSVNNKSDYFPSEGKLEIAIEDAVLLALEKNRSLNVERFNPEIYRTVVEQKRSSFDPRLTLEYSGSRQKVSQNADELGYVSDQTNAEIGISLIRPYGTEINASVSTEQSWSDASEDETATRTEIAVTQPLLQGRGKNVNLASLRQAEIDTFKSEYELRGFAEALVSELEQTCWNYILAQRKIDIYNDSLKLAGDQLAETKERVKIGKLAEIEIAASQAEVALRREDLINANSNLETIHLRLLRLINPPGENLWKREIKLLAQPIVPEINMDEVDVYVQNALQARTDLNQARLDIQRNELEIVKTKNGLLPKMDLFINLGKTGYAQSFNGSIDNFDDEGYDVYAGITFEYPFHNRGAKEQHRQAIFSRSKAIEALENLIQLVNEDVRSAYIEVNRTKEQVTATKATRELQKEKLRAETEKFRVGKSTTLLVAQAQRDLVASQISEIEAVINHIKALIDLYRLDGSLLVRRGISTPGQETVKLSLE